MAEPSFTIQTQSFGSEQSIHMVSQDFGSFWPTLKLTDEHRWGQSPLTDLKIGQNLDFLKAGQRRLGTSGMVRVDMKVVSIGPL